MEAIIIDDELTARQNLSQLLSHYCPELSIVSQFGQPSKAVQYLQNHPAPDCIFLDVEMPEMDGFELLQQVNHLQVKVIFVTAHMTYSLKALKANALDYLLKPIRPSELKTAVQKLTQHDLLLKDLANQMVYKESIQNMIGSVITGSRNKITVPHTNGLKIIDTNELIEIQAEGAYCNLIMKDATSILVSKHLKYFEDILDESRFIRIHYSSIINLDHLREFSSVDGGTVVMSNGKKILVAKRRIKSFKIRMNEYFS